VSADEELRRVLPVLEGVAAASVDAPVSIDTSKASVARAAIAAGARIVNDVSALRADPEMAELVAESGAECCLMHMLGKPRTMQSDPHYGDVVDEVKAFLEERLSFAVRAGVSEERIMLDPGIGFGKTLAHNLTLLRRLGELTTLGRPLVVGTSRKSFIGRIAADAAGASEPVAASGRLPGTIATNVLALERGASVFRVHDVAPVRDALAVAAATLSGRWTPRAGTTQTS
jgi:dihydropteroate synthase